MAKTSENRDFSSSQKKGYSDFEGVPCQLLAQSGHSSVLPYVDNRRTILREWAITVQGGAIKTLTNVS
jgi:hypothetical protein